MHLRIKLFYLIVEQEADTMGESGLRLIPKHTITLDVFASNPPPASVWLLLYI
jgi:hypothetical protein